MILLVKQLITVKGVFVLSLLQPPMGQLPSARVSASKPFTHTGVDFASPFNIRTGLRKCTLMKAYVAVFVCLSTKTVHLEPVSDLSSDVFMTCLKRFISRRVLPSHIWSDIYYSIRNANKISCSI